MGQIDYVYFSKESVLRYTQLRKGIGIGWKCGCRRWESKRREKEPTKWLLNSIKLVISVIRGKALQKRAPLGGMVILCVTLNFSPLCPFASHRFFSDSSDVIGQPSVFCCTASKHIDTNRVFKCFQFISRFDVTLCVKLDSSCKIHSYRLYQGQLEDCFPKTLCIVLY